MSCKLHNDHGQWKSEQINLQLSGSKEEWKMSEADNEKTQSIWTEVKRLKVIVIAWSHYDCQLSFLQKGMKLSVASMSTII